MGVRAVSGATGGVKFTFDPLQQHKMHDRIIFTSPTLGFLLVPIITLPRPSHLYIHTFRFKYIALLYSSLCVMLCPDGEKKVGHN